MRGFERSEKVQTMIRSGTAVNFHLPTLEIETDVEMDHDSRHHHPSSYIHMHIHKLFSMVARCRSQGSTDPGFPNGGGGGEGA